MALAALRAGHPSALMGAVDAREADVIVHHELPGLGSVVGPGAMELAIVVAVTGHARGIDDRPVGHVPEEKVGVVFQIRRLEQRRRQPQAVGVGRRPVPFLYRVPAAKRRPAAAVDQLAADVEVLVDHEHGCAEVARPDGGMQPHAARAKDNDIGFIIPFDALRADALRRAPCQNGRTHAGGSAALEEVAPAESLLVLSASWFFPPCVALLGHVLPPYVRQLSVRLPQRYSIALRPTAPQP